MPKLPDPVTRLRLLSGDAKAMLTQVQAGAQAGSMPQGFGARLAQWIATLDSLIRDAEEGLDPAELSAHGLLVRALSGADIEVDGMVLGLHEITQLAAALRPGASLTVRNSECLTPLEQTSIWTVMPGQVRFT